MELKNVICKLISVVLLIIALIVWSAVAYYPLSHRHTAAIFGLQGLGIIIYENDDLR